MSELQINRNGRTIATELTTERICRGIRGATTVEENSVEAILSATRELLYIIIRANDIEADDVASVIFTTTTDLNATYPALAARQLGWYDTALLCGNEMDVPGGLPRCIRILVHWNTSRHPKNIVHVYLRRAKNLRPDRSELPPIPMEEITAVINMDEAPLKVGSVQGGSANKLSDEEKNPRAEAQSRKGKA